MKDQYYNVLFKDKLGYINRISDIRKRLKLSSKWDDEAIVTLALCVLFETAQYKKYLKEEDL